MTEPRLREFWQCPTCTNRYWTLYPRLKLTCPNCLTRAVPIEASSYLKPDRDELVSTAFLSIDDPERTPIV